MNFRNLDYFTATAATHSFTQAAEKLFITQQTLSGQIASLERELGCKLFIRSKPLQLTEAGKILYSYSQGLLRDYQRMREEISLLSDKADNVVTIGISFPGAIQRLSRLIMACQKMYPETQLRFVELPSGDLIEKLRMRKLDFAVAHFPEHDPAFVRYLLFEEEIVLLATESFFQNQFGEGAGEAIQGLREGRFNLLTNCPYIRSTRNNLITRFAERFVEDQIPQPKVNTDADSFTSQIAICRSGAAFSFFPRSITAEMLHSETLSPFLVFSLGESAKYPIHYGYLKDSPRSGPTERFLQAVNHADA